ncbi:MAG TPA: hypothetical protein VM366_15985 [Anaerolineae bacterium]|nr:hypothetical protein [Anaerolineae bacterium]
MSMPPHEKTGNDLLLDTTTLGETVADLTQDRGGADALAEAIRVLGPLDDTERRRVYRALGAFYALTGGGGPPRPTGAFR